MPGTARTPLEVNFPAPTTAHVEEAVRRLVKAFEPLRIVAFGSWARGAARPGSDLDLLVVVSEEALDALGGRREAAVAMRRALSGLGVPKDVIATTPEQVAKRRDSIWHIVGSAMQEGTIVYEKPGTP